MTPRGHPDWRVPTGALSAVEIDQSELAVRLGFPDGFEGLGRVIYFELFATDLGGWEIIGSGSFNGADIQTNRYYWKPGSTRLTPGSTVDQNIRIQKIVPRMVARTMGFAAIWAITTDDVDIQLRLDVNDSALPDGYRVRVIGSSGEIAVLDDSSVYQTLATVGNMGSQARDWQYLKLIVDVENRVYKTVQFNEQRLDASAFSPPTISTFDPPSIIINIYAEDDTGNSEQMYVDSMVLTIDDP